MGELVLYHTPTVVELLQICYALSPDERAQYTALTGREYRPEVLAAERAVRPGPSWFVMAEGVPLAAAGFDTIRPGVAETWMLATPRVWRDYGKELTQYVDQVMAEMLNTQGYHRLQCVAMADRLLAHRWYRRIGLAPENTLRSYGCNGEDAILFSRVKVNVRQ